MTTSRFATFLAPLAFALAAAPVLAHGPGGGGACSGLKGQMEKLCAGAAPGTCLGTLCPDVPAGPGQWPQCLLNLNDGKETQKLAAPLTSACVTELNNKLAVIQQQQQAFTSACAGDVTTFCNNVTSGQRSTMQCLRQAVRDNKAVSSNCQTLLAQHHGHGHPPGGPGGFGPPCGPKGR
jgi:hypothetical protein